ncbi:MAG: sugar-transfer associated ATP-grasp domain-containing protein [Paracoccaceae bacterium]|nr:sugar-transfer associated ATP-grasp domain-containing protein [Paracoccaceae bacterium]
MFRGALFDADHAPVDPESFRSQIFDQYPYLYLKQASGLQGKGVSRVTAETFLNAIAPEIEAVLQYPIEVHPTLAEFASGDGTTLRVTTVYDKGPPRVVAAHLRFPRPGDTHVGASKNVSSVVDLETGELSSMGKRDGWVPTDRHPVTGKVFAGFVVPGFADACAVSLDHHARVPHYRYIGWDIAITPTGGIMFFEANVGHADVKISEAYYGPIFDGLGWDQLHKR